MVAGSLFFITRDLSYLGKHLSLYLYLYFLFVILGQYDDTHVAPIQQLKIWFIELPVLLRKKIRKKVFCCFCELSKYRFRVNIDFVNLARISSLRCLCQRRGTTLHFARVRQNWRTAFQNLKHIGKIGNSVHKCLSKKWIHQGDNGNCKRLFLFFYPFSFLFLHCPFLHCLFSCCLVPLWKLSPHILSKYRISSYSSKPPSTAKGRICIMWYYTLGVFHRV